MYKYIAIFFDDSLIDPLDNNYHVLKTSTLSCT